MKKILVFALMVVAFGCSSNTQRYVEGTSTKVGLYIPYDGQIFGCQIVSYLNGVMMQTTNSHIKVERSYCATNSYFGIVHTIESAKTKIETDNDK